VITWKSTLFDVYPSNQIFSFFWFRKICFVYFLWKLCFFRGKWFTNRVPLTIFFATSPMQQFDPFFFVHILSLVDSSKRLRRVFKAFAYHLKCDIGTMMRSRNSELLWDKSSISPLLLFKTPSVGCKSIKAKTKNKFIYLRYTFSDEFDDRFMSHLSYKIQWNDNS